MNKQNLIALKFLKDFKKDKENQVLRLDDRTNELIRIKNILINDIENIEAAIKEIESDIKEIENK